MPDNLLAQEENASDLVTSKTPKPITLINVPGFGSRKV